MERGVNKSWLIYIGAKAISFLNGFRENRIKWNKETIVFVFAKCKWTLNKRLTRDAGAGESKSVIRIMRTGSVVETRVVQATVPQQLTVRSSTVCNKHIQSYHSAASYHVKTTSRRQASAASYHVKTTSHRQASAASYHVKTTSHRQASAASYHVKTTSRRQASTASYHVKTTSHRQASTASYHVKTTFKMSFLFIVMVSNFQTWCPGGGGSVLSGKGWCWPGGCCFVDRQTLRLRVV